MIKDMRGSNSDAASLSANAGIGEEPCGLLTLR